MLFIFFKNFYKNLGIRLLYVELLSIFALLCLGRYDGVSCQRNKLIHKLQYQNEFLKHSHMDHFFECFSAFRKSAMIEINRKQSVLSLLDTLKYSINIVQFVCFLSAKWRSIKKVCVKCDLSISINVWCPAVNRLSLRWLHVCRWMLSFVTRWQHSPERQQHPELRQFCHWASS